MLKCILKYTFSNILLHAKLVTVVNRQLEEVSPLFLLIMQLHHILFNIFSYCTEPSNLSSLPKLWSVEPSLVSQWLHPGKNVAKPEFSEHCETIAKI